MIPRTFDEWQDCIVNKCNIPLTKEFTQKRLSVYLNKDDAETKKFISLYGEGHLNNIIGWLNSVHH